MSFKWKHCTIRQLPLQSPIVACGLGHLYSKEAVLEGLLDRKTLPESAIHIKSLKDVKDLNLTPNPAYEGMKAEKGDCYVDGGKSPYICPIIGLEMNGKYKFCFLWSCGCVMSERALKHVKSSVSESRFILQFDSTLTLSIFKVCHNCQKQYQDTDVVTLNPMDDLKLMEERMALRKASQKGSKKKKLNEDSESQSTSQEETIKKKIKKEDKAGPSKLNIPSQEAVDPDYHKAKECYSVAKDPKATEVFKSLFTSHQSAIHQDKAHWVTYNPFYN